MRKRYKGNRTKKILPVVGALLFGVVGTLLLQALFAARPGGGGSNLPNISISLFSTHPYASKAGFDSTSVNYYNGQKLCATSFCPVGQLITDMEITNDGQLVAGYGDWNANVDSFGVAAGRVGIIPLNLNTNTWGSFTQAGSEALDTIRKINGKIYAPTTDPSDSLGSHSGYITNESGSWQLKLDGVRQEHLFDVATLNGTDRWEMGAINDTSAVWHSVNNDGVFLREPRSVPGGYARYYWGAALNGKIYIGGAENAVFDGSSWSTSTASPCGTNQAKQVVVYEGKIFCHNGNRLNSFDGTTTTTLLTLDGQILMSSSGSTNVYQTESVKDLYADTTGLYVLSDLGKVYRVEPGTHALSALGQVTTGANTLAYYGGYLYFGYDQGKIYRTSNTIGTVPTQGVMAASAISPNTMTLDDTTKNVTITGSGFPAGVSVKVGKTTVPVVSQTDTQLVVAVDTAAVIKNDRFRRTGSKYLTVSLSASGYSSVNAPSLLVSYTKP